jgi:hypothetical protein
MSNTQNKEALELEAERVAFEADFPGYKAMLGTRENPKPSNMFKVWLHLRAQLAAPAGVPEDVLSLLKDARWRIANKPQHGAAKADFDRLDRPVLARIDAMLAAPSPAPASDVVQVPREWVAVQDGLPSVGDKCLIKIPVSKRFEVEGAEYKGDGDWLGAWCSRKGRDQTYKVSHWMLAGDLLNGGRV